MNEANKEALVAKVILFGHGADISTEVWPKKVMMKFQSSEDGSRTPRHTLRRANFYRGAGMDSTYEIPVCILCKLKNEG
jgi:hypothetical protein